MSKSKRRHAQAWAPYNFVPMPDKPLYADLKHNDAQGNALAQRHDTYEANGHTGYFEVTLTTETPLFIRGMLTEEDVTNDPAENGVRTPKTEKEIGELTRNNPNFFSIDGECPVIPGSSLRGMLRTLVEIVTNSKLHFVHDSTLVFRAIYYADALANTYRDIATDVQGDKAYTYPTRRMYGGYLRRGDSPSGWVIQPAQMHHGESFALVNRKAVADRGIPEKPPYKTYPVGVRPPTSRHWHTGKQGVQLEITEATSISREVNGDYVPATLLIASTVGALKGKGSNRTWYPVVYAEDPNAEPIPISQRVWDDFVLDRDLKRGIANRRIDSEGDVLFYLLDGQGRLQFFGPTMFFRMPYANSIQQLAPPELRTRNSRTDYAEALFGYVSERDERTEGKAATYAGRVSVTSAHVTGEPDTQGYYDEQIVPRILASPKPTTFQHYLEQPDAAKGLNGDVAKLHHYGTHSARLRGRKLYWRQRIEGLKSVKDDDQETPLEGYPERNIKPRTQHTCMKPVRSQVEFKFRVYFENLTAAELGALSWALTFGEIAEAPDNVNENQKDKPLYRHQLGMAKPLGLGVVKLTPQLVLTPRTERYGRLFDDAGQWFTAQRSATTEEQKTFVDAFKALTPDFDAQPHIQELLALAQRQEPNAYFSYMQIEAQDASGGKDNQYDGRPVLPRPSEQLAVFTEAERRRQEQIEAEQRKEEAARKQNFMKRVREQGLEIGDVIGGRVFQVDGDTLYVNLSEVYEDDNPKNPGSKTKNKYEAVIYGVSGIKRKEKVKARVVDITGDSEPFLLVCEFISKV
jgi:CRISPR-associated protein (TIGR03986 family)